MKDCVVCRGRTCGHSYSRVATSAAVLVSVVHLCFRCLDDSCAPVDVSGVVVTVLVQRVKTSGRRRQCSQPRPQPVLLQVYRTYCAVPITKLKPGYTAGQSLDSAPRYFIMVRTMRCMARYCPQARGGTGHLHDWSYVTTCAESFGRFSW